MIHGLETSTLIACSTSELSASETRVTTQLSSSSRSILDDSYQGVTAM